MVSSKRTPASLHLLLALILAAALLWAARQGADAVLDRLRPPPRPAAAEVAPADAAEVEEARAAEARRERVQREQEALAADKLRRDQQRAAMLEAREQALATERAEEARKQAAWERFYKRPRKCESPPDNATLVECGNHYLREQQRFEKAYAAGRI